MDNGLSFRRLHQVHIKRLLSIVGIFTALLALLHLFAYPYWNYLSVLSHENVGLVSLTTSNSSKLADSDISHDHKNDRDALSSDDMGQTTTALEMEERNLYQGSTFGIEGHVNSHRSAITGEFRGITNITTAKECRDLEVDSMEMEASDCNPHDIAGKQTGSMSLDNKLGSGKSALAVGINSFLVHKNESKVKGSNSLQVDSLFSNDISVMASIPALRKRGGKAMSITEMNSLGNNSVEKKSKRPRWSSLRDQELQDARFQIETASIQRNVSEVHASVFRNYSMFKRSYELMEKTLKVYVYREGEKPIFHMPYMRGIYASEGWFMKLMERNKQFVVKEPKKAHLFYLPFSSVKLRNALNVSGSVSQKDIENHLKNYVVIIASKYRLWNKRGGADHFLVACHDWAPRSTRNTFGNSIRVLCNSNIARGFKIGKDVSLPVTYIRSAENPLKDIGGNPPSNRPILAFFAGGMHGYVRPRLLQYWHNKKPDMKIYGPMPRDPEGKAKYREFMKSSKYCICAKGYEVHTPRVVESIYYECVPVIISDNYVPPLFEVFNWESFALFVLEDDIPNLRDILMSIPQDRYMMMQRRLKIVQQYFLWHKVPQRYDLFHMILHSVWYNRVFQVPR
ncbi:Acetylglucosaminyltransferase EXT1/exostosin 1 [Handroanthus impetiginosus]|uniref:Acetylglucosaminyltransferase EXT1/exostosin 1 n=1 Tax=Handroanthus impetiginosus TaxID=429701 RepID=A0A2G9GVB0_9LAMI|nr:Acetylglucosaminyltransferase EXT1/exostosin 1 [Handroanthus impetiginosus]